MENVWDYPRPPALQSTHKRLRVLWSQADPTTSNPLQDTLVIADTTKAFRVLETSHPPTYYIPPEDVNTACLAESQARKTMCEWKGTATYWDFKVPNSQKLVKGRIWSYEQPTTDFKPIQGFYSFYASPWTCMVDDETVQAQDGDFYGGWKTKDITGGPKGMKGGPGTLGW